MMKTYRSHTAVLLFFAAVSVAGANGEKTKKPEAESFQVLKPEELVFFNADHGPTAALSTMVYGLDTCRGDASEVLAVAISGKERKIMPLLKKKTLAEGAAWFDKTEIRRTIRACSDTWKAGRLSWTHFSPSWPMADIDKASLEEKKRFFLPASWIRVTADNTTGKEPLTVLFGIGVGGGKPAGNGILRGKRGNRDVEAWGDSVGFIDEKETEKQCGIMMNAFTVTAEPGQTKTFTLVLAEYKDKVLSTLFNAKFYYTSLFKSADEVLEFARTATDEMIGQCRKLDAKLESAPINEYRKFLAGHALHSYRYNTFCLVDEKGAAYWAVKEGCYGYINTFDLTVDHVFYELAMHPWTVRNELELFASRYTYDEKLKSPPSKDLAPGGIAFFHDMGGGFNFLADRQSYPVRMSQEELQNWILCAGLYWKKTGDTAWLKGRAKTIKACMDSMLLRDDSDPAKRDGITDWISEKGEITTYDALDGALKDVRRNLYIAVKSWVCYISLEAMCREIGDKDAAGVSREQALKTAKAVASQWDDKEKFIPAVFDGHSKSRIIPAVEGLAYAAKMGMAEAVSADGPYGDMIRKLKDHLDSALAPGVCLDKVSGGWKLSSTSENTWQSKVYISQYVAEKVLGLKGDRISGSVDAVHAAFQVLGCPDQCWSDQLTSMNGRCRGSSHYPRGVTSALWWLDDI